MARKRYSGVPRKVRWPSEYYQVSVGGYAPVVRQLKVRYPGGRDGLQSVVSLGLLFTASMSSSSLLSSEESVLVSSKAGVGARACTFKANARFEVGAVDPNDMGLSEQELCPKTLTPRLILGGAKPLTGDPGAKLSNAFSPAMTGDIGAGNPRRAKSKGGIVGEVSLKCGGVLGPAAPIVVSSEALG